MKLLLFMSSGFLFFLGCSDPCTKLCQAVRDCHNEELEEQSLSLLQVDQKRLQDSCQTLCDESYDAVPSEEQGRVVECFDCVYQSPECSEDVFEKQCKTECRDKEVTVETLVVDSTDEEGRLTSELTAFHLDIHANACDALVDRALACSVDAPVPVTPCESARLEQVQCALTLLDDQSNECSVVGWAKNFDASDLDYCSEGVPAEELAVYCTYLGCLSDDELSAATCKNPYELACEAALAAEQEAAAAAAAAAAAEAEQDAEKR